ncbi:MAG: M48 family metallopeptidase [Clostridia bacterium]|nr:M48 family metallopeptidase [Clostridia bacterium]
MSIEYVLKRNAKKNINITIKDDGTVVVSAPKRVSIAEINRVIERKKEWIEKAKSKQSQKKIIHTDLDIRDGEKIYFLGELKTIKIIPSKATGIFIENDDICFEVKEKYLNNQDYLNTHFYYALKEKLTLILTEYMNMYLKVMNLDVNTMKLRNMRSRFGTCMPTKKEILFNTYLIHYPLESIEYVVLHEVSHLIHANHSAKFYNVIAKYMPDWKFRKNKLKEYSLQ